MDNFFKQVFFDLGILLNKDQFSTFMIRVRTEVDSTINSAIGNCQIWGNLVKEGEHKDKYEVSVYNVNKKWYLTKEQLDLIVEINQAKITEAKINNKL